MQGNDRSEKKTEGKEHDWHVARGTNALLTKDPVDLVHEVSSIQE
jgi:hypothetical protein